MSKNTVADFAAELKKSPQELLEQLNRQLGYEQPEVTSPAG